MCVNVFRSLSTRQLIRSLRILKGISRHLGSSGASQPDFPGWENTAIRTLGRNGGRESSAKLSKSTTSPLLAVGERNVQSTNLSIYLRAPASFGELASVETVMAAIVRHVIPDLAHTRHPNFIIHEDRGAKRDNLSSACSSARPPRCASYFCPRRFNFNYDLIN